MCCIEMHIVCPRLISRFGTALMCLSTAVTLLLHCTLFPSMRCSPADVSCCCKCMQQGCSSSLAVGVTPLEHGHQCWDGTTSTRFTLQGTTVITITTGYTLQQVLGMCGTKFASPGLCVLGIMVGTFDAQTCAKTFDARAFQIFLG